MYAVEDNMMSSERITYLNVLMQGNISEKGIPIQGKFQEAEEVNLINLLLVDFHSNENEINVDLIVSNQIKNDVQRLVSH